MTELQPFKLSHYLAAFLHCRVWSVCNQLLLQVSADYNETMHTYGRHIEDVNFERIMAF